MANILANHTAAFIFYGGEWNDTSDEIRTTNTVGSTMFLEFSGTNFSAFGKFNPPNDNFTYLFDGQPPSGDVNAPVQSPQTPGQPFLALQNLAKGYHNITLNLTHGTLGLSRLMWFDPEASATNGSLVDPSSSSPAVHTTDGQWRTVSQSGVEFWATNTTLANITFSFQGTGIVIVGQTGPEGGSFNATLDNFAPVVRNANSGHQHLAALHRNDGLPDGVHTLMLTNTGGATLRVSQAQFFIAPPSSTSTTSTASSLSSTTSTASSPSSTASTWRPKPSLSKGAVAGISIGVLAVVGLLAVMLWLWLRRRLAASEPFEKNQVAYARLCSKCRQDITGDYRLECVRPDCPARIDLHPECKDWNIPEHHDHEVRQVLNT